MHYILSKFDSLGVYAFDEDNNFFNRFHITSRIEECLFEGKFEQTDHDVKIILPNIAPSEIAAQLTQLLQDWIDINYNNQTNENAKEQTNKSQSID